MLHEKPEQAVGVPRLRERAVQLPGARARLGGLPVHPGVRVRRGKRAEAGARGRRGGGHGAERGVRGVEAAGAGEEAEQRGVGERGRRVMAVGPVPGEEREGEVGVGEGGDGGGEARVGERGREERGEGAGPGRVGGAGGEDARERGREGRSDGWVRAGAAVRERDDAGQLGHETMRGEARRRGAMKGGGKARRGGTSC